MECVEKATGLKKGRPMSRELEKWEQERLGGRCHEESMRLDNTLSNHNIRYAAPAFGLLAAMKGPSHCMTNSQNDQEI